jgi:hypothetical protein
MPIEWKKGDDGQPVIKDGKAVLFDTETQAVYEVDPAANHAQNLQLRSDLPARNAEITTLKAELAGFEKIKATHADLLEKPQEVAAKLKRLEDLEASTGGKTVDEQVAALRAEQEAAVEKLRADHAAELTEREERLSLLEKKMTMDKFLLPWQSDKLLDGYRLPRDPAALEFLLLQQDEWGKKFVFQQDGKVIGPDGLPMQDSSPGEVLKYILDNHPQRASWKLSTMPEGTNIGGTGGGGEQNTEALGTEYAKMNADVISKTKAENPQLHAELMKKHLPNLADKL